MQCISESLPLPSLRWAAWHQWPLAVSVPTLLTQCLPDTDTGVVARDLVYRHGVPDSVVILLQDAMLATCGQDAPNRIG